MTLWLFLLTYPPASLRSQSQWVWCALPDLEGCFQALGPCTQSPWSAGIRWHTRSLWSRRLQLLRRSGHGSSGKWTAHHQAQTPSACTGSGCHGQSRTCKMQQSAWWVLRWVLRCRCGWMLVIDRHCWQDMCVDSGYTEVDVPVNILVYVDTNTCLYANIKV